MNCINDSYFIVPIILSLLVLLLLYGHYKQVSELLIFLLQNTFCLSRVHDFDNNMRLDGLELLKALLHAAPETGKYIYIYINICPFHPSV